MRRGRAWAIALALVAALISVLLDRLTSSRLFVTGSTVPVPVWGPAIDRRLCTVVLGASVLGILLAPGRRWRTTASLVWLLALAVLTHRLVDGQDVTATSDQWLGVEITRLGTGIETDPAPATCPVGLIPALCVTRHSQRLRTPTLVSFAPMVDRPDAPDRLTAGQSSP